MRLSEIRQILEERDIRLTKSLGQNFLHDGNQLDRIMAAAEVGPQDKVLEIGPGLGPLTERLVAEAGEVLAIEKDRRLFDFLNERFGSAGKLKLVHADALEYLGDQPLDLTQWKMVSNLPYSVASRILVELAESERPPQRMVATLQIEVARRLAATEADQDYGLLTLLVQLRYQPRGWFKIPAACFFPAPEIDSACITLERRPAPLLSPDEAATFTRVVKRSFSQRRKMMLKLLKTDWAAGPLENAFLEVGLPAQTRAEEVSLEQFVKLTRLLHVGAS